MQSVIIFLNFVTTFYMNHSPSCFTIHYGWDRTFHVGYFLMCMVYKNKDEKSENKYCISHELLIIMNSELKRNDPTVNQLHAITHNIIDILIPVNVTMYKLNVGEYRRGNQKKKIQKKKKKHHTICVGHHYRKANTNNVNKTSALLHTTGKDEPHIAFMRKSQRTPRELRTQRHII